MQDTCLLRLWRDRRRHRERERFKRMLRVFNANDPAQIYHACLNRLSGDDGPELVPAGTQDLGREVEWLQGALIGRAPIGDPGVATST